MNTVDETHVFMELMLRMTKVILDSGECHKDMNWDELGCELRWGYVPGRPFKGDDS